MLLSLDVLEQHLPARFEPITDKDKATECLSTILKQSLPNSQKSEVDNDKYWSYILDRHSSENKKPVQKFSKKKTLSRKDKQQLGLLKLPKDGWQYEKLTAMNDMWKNYMRENLELVNRTEVDCSTLSTILSKSELIGAEVTIDRSIVPNYVGMQGIIVLESKSTFQIVTKKSKLKSKYLFAYLFLVCKDRETKL